MTKKKRKKKLKLKKKAQVVLNILLVIILIVIAYRVIVINKDTILQEVTQENKEKEDKQYTEYTTCLTGSYTSGELSDTLQNKIDELTSVLSKYRVSIAYEDIMTNFSHSYNSKVVYYAASTVKMLDAIYVLEKHLNNELDINTEVQIKDSYKKVPNSPALKNKEVGSNISLKELVKNAIIYSDNGAHLMLYDYLGYSSLKSYATSLGATEALIGDQFGSINVNDALIYSKKLYELINKSGDLGEEVKSWFINSDENYVTKEDTPAAIKYGGFNEYFHNIGIVYATNPYYLVILSTNGNNENSVNMINEISSKVKELHELFYSNRQEYCTFKVYNQ